MHPTDYDRRKHALDEQLRLGIELLQSAYQVQLRALELMRWSDSAAPLPGSETAGPAPAGTLPGALAAPSMSESWRRWANCLRRLQRATSSARSASLRNAALCIA